MKATAVTTHRNWAGMPISSRSSACMAEATRKSSYPLLTKFPEYLRAVTKMVNRSAKLNKRGHSKAVKEGWQFDDDHT